MINLSKRTLLLALSLFIIPTMSFAFFCPTNFKLIDFGDTIDQVTQQCGKPNTQTETNQSADNAPQEWQYYVPQTVAMSDTTQVQGTLKTSFSFDQNGKVINISVNGIGVGSTTICGNNIQLGDTKDTVKAACGQASFINKSNNGSGLTPEGVIKVTTFNYQTTPPMTLIFENGILKTKQ